eukprot:Skav218447  [mRNA]  locus=scaffold905:169369:171247:+ [translate_table: standard]
MDPWLCAFYGLELLVCCYGNIWPDQVGYYLSHRYWAGNWVQSFFYIKKTQRRSERSSMAQDHRVPQQVPVSSPEPPG